MMCLGVNVEGLEAYAISGLFIDCSTRSFANAETKRIYFTGKSRRFPSDILK